MMPADRKPVWQLGIKTPAALAEAVSDWLESIADAACMDLHVDHIRVTGIFQDKYDDVLLRQQLAALSPDLHFDWQLLPPVDWLAETARGGAGTIGRLRLLDAWAPGCALLTCPDLYVQSARAFGDGFHATTQGCLQLLQHIAKRHHVRRYADIGCGTGVLSLAARKLWPQAQGVLGDIDAEAVGVTRQNARANGGTGRMAFATGPGLGPRHYKKYQPYDLVLANILAGPLCRLAPAVAAALRPGGHAVLSGLLANQQNMVLAAYRQQGLRLVKSVTINGWVTLHLRK